MARYTCILFFVSIFFVNVYSQQLGHNQTLPASSTSPPVYFERVDSGLYVFYFDQYYYLSDKMCQYTAIERYTSFDFSQNIFHGEFKDYDLQGRLILTGNYNNGWKEGVFRAYHANGQLKWETTYQQDFPDGEARYYYPDGKPMLIIMHGEQGIEINDYWDRSGQHRVRSGEGRYTMHVELDGYSEYGASFVQRQGRIREGKPDGSWSIHFVYANGDVQHVGFERYQQGRINLNQIVDVYELLPGESKTAILPLNWFHRAEIFISKECSIDHHTGFSRYLEQFLDDAFLGQASLFPPNAKFEFEVDINKDGGLRRVVSGDPVHVRYIQEVSQVLSSITYWIPSWDGSNFIADKIHLHIEVMRDDESASPRFFLQSINRESGS